MKLSLPVFITLIVATLSFNTAHGAKGKRHVSTDEGSNTTYSDDVKDSHRPLVDVTVQPNGNINIQVVTPMRSSHDHFIKSHAILNDDKDLLVKNRFNFAKRESFTSTYKFQHLEGRYYVESICNEHGRWIEPVDIK